MHRHPRPISVGVIGTFGLSFLVGHAPVVATVIIVFAILNLLLSFEDIKAIIVPNQKSGFSVIKPLISDIFRINIKKYSTSKQSYDE